MPFKRLEYCHPICQSTYQYEKVFLRTPIHHVRRAIWSIVCSSICLTWFELHMDLWTCYFSFVLEWSSTEVKGAEVLERLEHHTHNIEITIHFPQRTNTQYWDRIIRRIKDHHLVSFFMYLRLAAQRPEYYQISQVPVSAIWSENLESCTTCSSAIILLYAELCKSVLWILWISNVWSCPLNLKSYRTDLAFVTGTIYSEPLTLVHVAHSQGMISCWMPFTCIAAWYIL